MAATVELKVNLAYEEALGTLSRMDKMLFAMTKTPYEIRFNVQGIEQLKEFQGLSKELNAIARWQNSNARLQKEQNKQEDINLKKRIEDQKELARLEREAARQRKEENKDTYLSSSAAKYDAEIKAAEASSRRFANALQAQMQQQLDLENSNRNLASSYNEYDQAIAKREQEGREFSAALKQQMQAEQEAAAAAKKSGQDAEQSASGWSALGNAISTALGHLASRALWAAMSKISQGIREALTEMKNVDTELVNISKVSGITGEELAAIGDRAYETASKYGVAASEYLSAVYDMQKAGMGDQSESMGELAVKTMLVGDTTKEVASKFLLAANAAWKFNGDMGRLSQVVDEADYINNNYATTLDKLASGMPIVASVAAQAGMSAEETMAALGTITHVTQETGTKAATALRALILNISGQVGKFVTEEGEEFEVTAESVKSLQGLLEKYAKTEMDAAKAAGELVNPMTAIQALFKGMAESDLNDVELFNLLSSMGGKLRTNQLTALVQNYELFDEMLGRIGNSAGTADKEISLMMESWERKTQVLKNTWTEFIADIVDTDTIKGFVEGLTDVVNVLDDIVNQSKNPFFDSESAQRDIGDISKKIKELESAIAGLQESGGSDLELQNLKNQLEILKQISDLKNDQYKKDREEEARKLQNQYTDEYLEGTSRDRDMLANFNRDLANIQFAGDTAQLKSDLTEIVSQYGQYYDNLIKIRDADIELTDAQNEFLGTYEGVMEAAESSALYTRESADGWWDVVDAQGNVVGQVKDIATAEREASEQRQAEIEQVQAQRQAVLDFFTAPFEALTQYYQDYYANILGAQDSTESLTGTVEDTATAGGDAAESAGEIGAALSGDIGPASALLSLVRAIADAAASVSLGGGGFALGTTNAPGGPTLVNELGPELISENGRAYIANGGRPGVVNLSRGAIVLPASVTEQALKGGGSATRVMQAAAAGTGFRTVSPQSGHDWLEAWNAETIRLAKEMAARRAQSATGILAEEAIIKKTGGGGGGSKGGGGSGKSAQQTAKEAAEKLAEETKDILSNLEKQAKLADNRGQYDKEVQLYGKAQTQIDKMVAAYKKAGYKETDDEILDLLNKRYDYEKKKDAASKKTIEEAAKELNDKLSVLDKQAKLATEEGDYLKEVQFYETAQEAIKEMVDRYRKAGYKDDSNEILSLLQKNYDYANKQVSVYKDRWNDLIDALETDTEAQELANKLAEKEQAVADARTALENAQRQRTIRMFNAQSGQWEWVADQSKISTAQQSLTKAEESYAEEVKDQAIKELERLRDTMADLNDVILGPALSAIIMKSESSDEFQNFARALNAVYGVGSYLSSTEGSSKVISTANDSHDTIYSFGNVTLTEEQASTMSVAQLAQKLQVLKIS